MSKRNKVEIVCAVGARPNFIKIAPILEALNRYPQIKTILVHTGQHYDREMSEAFFDDLALPRPDVDLGVGSGSHGGQTGRVLEAFERFLLRKIPDLVLVVGDVNSTLACALAAVKLHIPVAHVEAGLRSFNRKMPEEINRILTDQISDFLFTTSTEAEANLLREGIAREKIFFVGNVMIDSLNRFIRRARKCSPILSRLRLSPASYAVLTLHRPEAADDQATLRKTLRALGEAAKLIKVVYPVHPRTRRRLKEFGLEQELSSIAGLIVLPPLGYLDFLNLMRQARLVLTDSGGIQEETTVLGIPCLTLRSETERPVTVTEGTNTVVGFNGKKIRREVRSILAGRGKKGRIPRLWDGRAAVRIAQVLAGKLTC